jgi:glycosyltransferase involved in cell wall biosynthesis
VKEKIRGDILEVGRDPDIDISVICPFFNEEQILGDVIPALLAELQKLDATWELIVIDDGSTDRSREIVAELAKEAPLLRLLYYRFNRGRGHALRAGIQQARGAVIITTEIDLSWGENIVRDLYEAMNRHQDADMVVASPHLSGGGYRNVPLKRVFFSKLGNWIIRACMTNAVTMNTGMTRAYRRDSIRSLPLEDDRKEFHLEVILKARALDYRIYEIPAVLEWKEYKHQGRRVDRKSSSGVNRLVLTHSLFSLFGNPIHYVWALAALSATLSVVFLGAAVWLYVMEMVSVYSAIISLALAIIAVVLFALGILAQQGNMIQRELWRLKQDQWRMQQDAIRPPSSSPQQER